MGSQSDDYFRPENEHNNCLIDFFGKKNPNEKDENVAIGQFLTLNTSYNTLRFGRIGTIALDNNEEHDVYGNKTVKQTENSKKNSKKNHTKTTIFSLHSFAAEKNFIPIIPSASILFNTIKQWLPSLLVLDLRFFPSTIIDAENLNRVLYDPSNTLDLDQVYLYNWFSTGQSVDNYGTYIDRLLYKLGLRIMGIEQGHEMFDGLMKEFVMGQKREKIGNRLTKLWEEFSSFYHPFDGKNYRNYSNNQQ
jgi:hypothetical protein